MNQLLGIDSRVVYTDEIAELCPELDLSDQPTWPIMGALYHPPGGIIRHDAVVWGFARGADRARRRDPPVHRGDRDRAPRRPRHRRARRTAATSRATRVVSATAGWSTLVCEPRRRAAADHDAHPPGVRDRAGEAVPRRDHRLGADARLRLADRPRRVPDRRRDRAVHDRTRATGTLPVPRVLGAARARALPAARAARRSCARGRASATSRPTTARSSARRRSRASTSRPAGAPTASRRRRSSARRSPSSSRPGRRPT